MPAALLYSAPNENYLEHISRCKEKFEKIYTIYRETVHRIFGTNNQEQAFLEMILFHDLGKLTQKWQEILSKEIKENKNLHKPSHSTLGAAYLWKILPAGVREPLCFAVAIHHTDRGLLGDNIERPDVQAILDGIVDNEGKIRWHNETLNLEADLFPQSAKELTINDLKEMARGLRIWAKGCGILEQHQRRIQVSLAHHILKLCDISAATERKEYKKKDSQDYYGGWIMVENIKNYVDAVSKRVKS